MTSHAQAILAHARALGFEQATLIPVSSLPEDALHAWLAEARHLPLDYMQEHPRHDPRHLLAEARSVLVVTKSYLPKSPTAHGALHIARYAHHLDYHEVLRERLAHLAHFIAAETGCTLATRSATDSAPLLERALAARAGLGWVGKNTLLIHPSLGSYFFIAELLLDIDLHTPAHAQPPRCGSCSRCIDACPTQAIVAPYVLDARRCISTWTIESSGPIPRWIRPKIGQLLFGCDICQEVCPWNSKAQHTTDPDFLPPPTQLTLRPADLLCLTSRQFNRIFARSPLLRAGRTGIARNAAVVLGNQRDASALPILHRRLAIEPSSMVRGHIAWALGQIATPDALARLEHLTAHDPDTSVREEAHAALGTLPPLMLASPTQKSALYPIAEDD